MTTITNQAADPGRAPVLADLLFWTAVGAVLAAASGPLADAWAVPREALVGIGLGLVAIGPSAIWGLQRVRPLPGRLVLAFALGNLALTPVVLLAAALDWLRMSSSGNATLAVAAAVTLLLGGWQLSRTGHRGAA